jgi:hypothetical protein
MQIELERAHLSIWVTNSLQILAAHAGDGSQTLSRFRRLSNENISAAQGELHIHHIEPAVELEANLW